MAPEQRVRLAHQFSKLQNPMAPEQRVRSACTSAQSHQFFHQGGFDGMFKTLFFAISCVPN